MGRFPLVVCQSYGEAVGLNSGNCVPELKHILTINPDYEANPNSCNVTETKMREAL
jgi:hypothetical protein